jgi:predicted ATPase
MKITRIRKARNYRIFRDFAWPGTGLPEFSRFNVIYGWNGTGKTSISNIFRHLQTRAPLTDGDVEIQVDQTRVAGADFGKVAILHTHLASRPGSLTYR